MFVYIIHFDRLMTGHAKHYVGSTNNVQRRLHEHANGKGANILLHAMCGEIEWELGGLYQCDPSDGRDMEGYLKTHHNHKRYCELCNVGRPKIPRGLRYPLPGKPFKVRSEEIRTVSMEELECMKLMKPSERR